MHTFDFKNRTAIITGGAQGFGLDIAKRFLDSGAKVYIWDIDEKLLKAVVDEIKNPNLAEIFKGLGEAGGNRLIKMFGDSGVAYAVLIMTVLIVIFAEILPKSYAISNSEKMALTISPIIRPFVFFLSPITWLMEKIVHGILAIFGMNYIKNSRSLSVQDEIRGTVDLHHKEGRLYKFDKDMVKGILDLSVIGIEDVMVHRSNMFTVNIDDDANNIISAVINSPYTRIPVWKNDAENIIGIIHAKNLLRLISTKKNLPILKEDI